MGGLFHRYATEPIGFDPISFVSGVVQTALYVDFFYIYFTRYDGDSFTRYSVINTLEYLPQGITWREI